MDVTVSFRRIESSAAVKQYAEDKIERIARYLGRRTADATVVVSQEKRLFRADVAVNAHGMRLRCREQAVDLFEAIDLATDTLAQRLLRHRGRLSSLELREDGPTGGEAASFAAHALEPEMPEHEAPHIVPTDIRPRKPMAPDEAAMQLDLEGLAFLLFVNAETDRTNVIYRRDDGAYGLIDTSLPPAGSGVDGPQ